MAPPCRLICQHKRKRISILFLQSYSYKPLLSKVNSDISLGNAFISLEISSSFLIYFSLFSFILAWTFISLQIKEFRIMGLSINDSVYSCLFFFLTGLHFFHLVVGLLLLSLLFWSCSFSFYFSFSFSYWWLQLQTKEKTLRRRKRPWRRR